MLAMIQLLGVQTREAFLLHCPLDMESTVKIEADLKPLLMEETMDDDFCSSVNERSVNPTEKVPPTISISQANKISM